MEVAELADFAILLLGIVVNQAGCERDFSDLKIKKTRLRNRLGLPKLHKMSKVCLACFHVHNCYLRSHILKDWRKYSS